VSDAIKTELERRKGMNLATSSDDKLGVCKGCSCPMKLKVHVPFGQFWPDMLEESKAALWGKCWILEEAK
jgi:hypothetical protein